MTILEARFMERVPVLLNDLLKEVKELKAELKAVKEELNSRSEEK